MNQIQVTADQYLAVQHNRHKVRSYTDSDNEGKSHIQPLTLEHISKNFNLCLKQLSCYN